MFYSAMKVFFTTSLLAFLLVSFSACNNAKKKEVNFPIEVMGDDVVMNATKSRIDTIDIGHEFNTARKYYVYHDTILIVRNDEKTTSYFVEVFNLLTKSIIAQLYPRGNGHGELLSCWLAINGNKLIVNDFMKSQYAVVDMDSLILNESYSVLPKTRSYRSSSIIVPFGDRFLLENPYCFSCRKEDIFEGAESIEQGIENGVSRFIISDLPSDDDMDDEGDYRYWTRNVAVDGQIVVNKNNTNVLYASSIKSEIEVYDANLSIKKVLKGPITLNSKFAVRQLNDGDLPLVMCYQTVPYTYLGYASNQDNDVSFLFIGDYLETEASTEHFKSHIVVVDWDGNLKKYIDVDKFLTSISKSYESDNVYYGMIHNDEGLPRLVKITADEN